MSRKPLFSFFPSQPTQTLEGPSGRTPSSFCRAPVRMQHLSALLSHSTLSRFRVSTPTRQAIWPNSYQLVTTNLRRYRPCWENRNLCAHPRAKTGLVPGTHTLLSPKSEPRRIARQHPERPQRTKGRRNNPGHNSKQPTPLGRVGKDPGTRARDQQQCSRTPPSVSSPPRRPVPCLTPCPWSVAPFGHRPPSIPSAPPTRQSSIHAMVLTHPHPSQPVCARAPCAAVAARRTCGPT